MKTLITITVMLLSAVFCSGQSYLDTKDFQLHAWLGVTAGAFGGQMNETLDLNIPKSLAYIGTATAAGLVKELYDATQKNNHFDEQDWAATMFGGFVAWLVDEGFTLIGVNPKYVRAGMMATGIFMIGIKMNL